MSPEHEVEVLRTQVKWWKAETLLQACRKGATLDQVMIAASIPVPVPEAVAQEHLEKAKEACALVFEERKVKDHG
jgi:hypothetical protein